MDELNEQEKMDQLIAELTADGDPQPSAGALDQGAIDRLFGGTGDSAPEEAVTEDPFSENGQRFDQEALDRLLGASLDNLPVPEPKGSPVVDPEPSRTDDSLQAPLDQSELDDLFSSLYQEKDPVSPQEPEQTAPPTGTQDLDAGPAEALEIVAEDGFDTPEEQDPLAAPQTSFEPSERAAETDAPFAGTDGPAVLVTEEPQPTSAEQQVQEPEGPRTDPVFVSREISPPAPAPGTAARAGRIGRVASVITIAVALVFSGIAIGWHYFHHRPEASPLAAVVKRVEPVSVKDRKPEPTPPPASPSLDGLLDEIDLLREAYRSKRDEIVTLQDHYRDAIRVHQEEIRTEAKGSREFKQAVVNKRIELGLKTIQRQQAYIQKLEESARRLMLGEEELLFIRREIETDARMVPFARSVTLDRLFEQANKALEHYALTPEKVAVDLSAITLAPLEEIWQAIGSGPQDLSAASVPVRPVAGSAAIGDADIQDQIRRGRFDNKHRLTALPPETAACLAAWKGKDLFLNYLSQLPAPSAAILAGWKGQWLCLNGLTELSEATASELARWPGRRLSLNGLTSLPAAAAVHLACWPGRDLELAGLSALSPEAARHLAGWQAAGGKIFVSNHFRWPRIASAQ